MTIKKVLNCATIGFILYFVSATKPKSSLTFVIDNTNSMTQEIDAVKNTTHRIFEQVINSKESNIDSFILVTFADPDAEFRVDTQNETVFMKALKDIKLQSGGKCPEASMTGILEGLKRSKPNSFLYAFTDASANDYQKKEEVIKLSMKKSIQVSFLLTDKCLGYPKVYYQPYHDLAVSTSGHIFNIKKDEVSKVIEFVTETLEHKYSILSQKFIKKTATEDVKFTIDSKISNVFISVSTEKPYPVMFNITDSNGNIVKTKLVLSTEKNTIVQLDPEIVGNYTINFLNVKKTVVTISGSTSLSFQYGFSSTEPNSLKETSVLPIGNPKDYNYLLIELDNNKNDVSLENVELIDEKDNVLAELHLKFINKKAQLYVTDPFKNVVKNFSDLFRVRINGYNDNKEKITRISINKMTYTEPEIVVKNGSIPTKVTMLTKSPQIVELNDNLTINCEINASPQPKIIWFDSKGNNITHEVKKTDPVHYTSTLNIEKVDKNSTFFCKAVNENGEDSEFVAVEVKKRYFNILEYPKDTSVVFGESVDFKLIISADTPYEISWYKASHKITNDDNFQISSDNTLLKIKHMHSALQGIYFARIKNTEFKFEIKLIEESDIPQIDKSKSKYHVKSGEEVIIHCRTIKGKPTPVKTWFFKNNPSSEYTNKGDADALRIKKISLKMVGMYKCVAHNNVGNDSFEIEVFVDSAPVIRKEGAFSVAVESGETKILPCTVDGYPKPEVNWFVNDTHIKDSNKYEVFKNNNSLRLTASINDRRSYYTCFAKNNVGNHSIKYEVFVYVGVHIDPPPVENKTVNVGCSISLTCPANGDPLPTVKWFLQTHQDMESTELSIDERSFDYKISHIQGTASGKYFCTARNNFPSKYNNEKIVYVDVTVAPQFKDPGKTIHGIVGDLMLRMPCMPKYGSPKPTIEWEFKKDSNNYKLYENGTLVLENITKNNEGSYICKAYNSNGEDFLSYDVKIDNYPDQTKYSMIYRHESGTTLNIKCVDQVGTLYERVRWFKGKNIVKTFENCKETACNYIQDNASEADTGIYSCRFNTRETNPSAKSVRVFVGSKLKFKHSDMDKIKETNNSYTLHCDVEGTSISKVEIKWYYERAKISKESSPTHIVNKMDVNNFGSYKCTVKNDFIEISREFKIQSDIVCQVNLRFHKHRPLIGLSPHFKLPREEINFGRNISIVCKKNSLIIGSDYHITSPIDATCVQDTIFKTDHGSIDISKLKCESQMNFEIKGSRKRCVAGNSELLDIEFNEDPNTVTIFYVCWDKENHTPRFIHHFINPNTIKTKEPFDNIKEITSFITNKYTRYNYTDLYDCEKQFNAIQLTTGVRLNEAKDICFYRRQLVNPKDMLPGLPQLATFSYLNVVPQWRPSGDENWNEVERLIRSRANSLNEPLEIWSGASNYDMKLYVQNKSNNRFVTLNYGSGKQHPIPRFIWKVVIQQSVKKGFAIVIINTPNLSLDLIEDEMHPCINVCHETEWMNYSQWRNPKKGFVFCCSLKDFKKKFNYENLFPSYDHK